MKIKSLQTIELRIPYSVGAEAQTSAWGGKDWSTADALFVRIETTEGVVGWGEAFGYTIIPGTKAVMESMIKPLCEGQTVEDIKTFMDDLQKKLHIFGRGGPVIYGLSGLDIALWDILGKTTKTSISDMLGESKQQQIPAYASLVRFGDPSAVRESVKKCVDQGFRHIKLHEIDYECIVAARDVAGDDIAIMLDVNCPWSEDQAIEMAKKLQSVNPSWLEEPVWPPEDHQALARIKTKGGIPVAAGENAATLTQYRTLFESNSVDIVQPSPIKTGGISTLKEVFALADQFSVRVVPHSFYEGPGLLAAIHAVASMSSDPLVEWRYFDCEAHVYGDDIVPSNGYLRLPEGPGLGRDPLEEIIARYKAE